MPAPGSKRMSPLAIIILAIAAVILVVAFSQWRGTLKTTPDGASTPTTAPAESPIMPQQSTAPAAQQPASTEPGGSAAHDGTLAGGANVLDSQSGSNAISAPTTGSGAPASR